MWKTESSLIAILARLVGVVFNCDVYRSFGVFVLFCTVVVPAYGQTSVLTQHNDNARTGQNTSETILNTSNVNVIQFGKLFAMPSDGQVYAQPLYVPGVTINGGVHNVVIIATENDSVYAYDADSSGAPLWKASLVDAAHGAGAGEMPLDSAAENLCSDLHPEVGITSTPVIDPTSKTIYVEAKSTDGLNYFHRLHALDLFTGNEKTPGPVVISGTVSGTGDGSSNGQLAFDNFHQLNRPGLLLLNGTIYIAYASHCDNSPSHGWLFAYDAATFTQKSVYVTTPNGGMGGFWMSGAGVAADTSGNIFIASGNGDFDTTNVPATETGDTILKLDTTNQILTQLDYFTPEDQATLRAGDVDLGSGGVLLLPDQPGSFPHILVAAGKEGRIYVVNRDQMTTGNSHFCSPCTNDSEIIEESSSAAVGSTFNVAAYWNNTLYLWGVNDVLKSIPITNGLPDFTNVTGSTPQIGFPGAGVSVSSNGTTAGSAIVWAIDGTQYGAPRPAVLYAYDATNILTMLYSSAQNATRDAAGNAVKFAVPTVANGKVYVGTSTEVDVYGLIGANPLPNISSITPSSATAGGPAFPLTVNGTGYISGATVNFGSNPAITPSSVTSTQIVATIPAADIATAGAVNVTVTNPAAGGTSNAQTFTINNPAPTAPAITSVSASSNNTFTLVQQVGVHICSGSTTCNITVASTGSGHLLFLSVGADSVVFLTGVRGGGTWTIPSSCQMGNGAWGAESCGYVLSSTSGATTITLTLSSTNTYHVVFWEYSSTLPSTSLDVIGTAQNTGNGTTVSGVSLSLTGSNDVIIQWSECNATGVASPYGNYMATSEGAFADNENSTNVAATNMWDTTYTLTACGQAGAAFTSTKVNQAPAITSANSTSFSVGTAGSFTVTATGSPTPSLSETGALPSGVTFKDNGNGTGALSGTPASGTAGTYPLTFTASNGVGTAASQSFTLTVGSGGGGGPSNFAYVSGSVTGVVNTSTSGSTLSVTLHQNPGAGHLLLCAATWQSSTATASMSDPNNGTWKSVGSAKTGIGSLSPYRGQTFYVPSTVSASTTVTLTISSAVQFRAFECAEYSYSGTVSALDGTPQYSTTPASGGVATISGLTTSNSSDLVFVDCLGVDTTCTAGSGYTGLNDNNTYDAGSGSFGNSFWGITGQMIEHKVGVAAGAQSATFGTGTATDNVILGLLAMTSSQVNQAPAITSANSASFSVGTAGSFTVTATGNPTPSLSETGAMPSGVTFKDNGNGTGTLSGTPASGTAGTYPLTFTASNGVGTAASQSFTLTVGSGGGGGPSNFAYVSGSVTGVLNSSTGSSTTLSVTLHQNPGAGHLLLCAATWQSSTATASMSDPNNGTWKSVGSAKTGIGSLSPYRGQTFYVPSTVSASTTVTLTISSAVQFRAFECAEYSYSGTVSALDGTPQYSTTPASGGVATISGLTTSNSSDLVFVDCLGVDTTCTAGSGYTGLNDNNTYDAGSGSFGNSFWGITGQMIEHKVGVAAGAQSATFGTGTATDNVILGLLAF